MILEEDFQNILENYGNISTLYNKTILVTGATGFIGSLLIRFFLYLNKNEDEGVHIASILGKSKETLNLNGQASKGTQIIKDGIKDRFTLVLKIKKSKKN